MSKGLPVPSVNKDAKNYMDAPYGMPEWRATKGHIKRVFKELGGERRTSLAAMTFGGFVCSMAGIVSRGRQQQAMVV